MFRPYGHFPQQQQQQPTTAAAAATAAEQPFHMASLLYPAGTTENHGNGASQSAAAGSFARNMHVSIFLSQCSGPYSFDTDTDPDQIFFSAEYRSGSNPVPGF
jgi:hypothetical protein